MGSCCGSHDVAGFPRKEGKVAHRTITDMAWMVAFWVFAVLMGLCIFDGSVSGNMKRLTHGADWEGNLCGIDAAVLDKPFMMFCGSPQRNGDFPQFIIEGSSACVSACPATSAELQIDCLMPAYHNFTTYKKGKVGALTNVETLDMTLTQSVTSQFGYPTEAYGGRFCLPSKANVPLRDLLINGPWGKTYRPLVTFGGLVDAWPLFAISAAVAVVMGMLYMFFLEKCAGCLIFVTMILSTLLTLALGIFFFLAVLMDFNDLDTVYAKFNPICSVFVGEEAKVYSVVTGIVLILSAVLMGAIAITSMAHVDEYIGLIAASTEALQGLSILKLYPFLQAAVGVVLFFLLVLVGFPMVMSLGSLDYTEIEVDGVGVEGLQRVWKRTWLQHKMCVFYGVGAIFFLEFYIQLGHYTVAYIVSTWYFTPGDDIPIDNNQTIQKALGGQNTGAPGKQVEVRVAGIDPNYGPRQGSVVMTSAGKMLVLPVGKKGPGLGRLDMEQTTFKKRNPKDPSFTSMLGGVVTAVIYHVGSLALGSLIIFFMRPFNIAGKIMHHFLHKTKEPETHWNDHQAHHRHNESPVRGCMTLFVSIFEQVFGQFSKDAFNELVLNGADGFLKCAPKSFHEFHKAGGTIAHLHGSMMLFQMFGVLWITMMCGWTTLIIQDKVDMFNEPGGSHYIEDKTASAIAATVIGFCIAFAWMSTWAQIADVLLYCVAWNRGQRAAGKENHVKEEELILPVNKYCPQNLRYLMPAHEREEEYSKGLHGHGQGMGHAMQILATMEHGIMQTLSGEGGPGGSVSGASG